MRTGITGVGRKGASATSPGDPALQSLLLPDPKYGQKKGHLFQSSLPTSRKTPPRRTLRRGWNCRKEGRGCGRTSPTTERGVDTRGKVTEKGGGNSVQGFLRGTLHQRPPPLFQSESQDQAANPCTTWRGTDRPDKATC